MGAKCSLIGVINRACWSENPAVSLIAAGETECIIQYSTVAPVLGLHSRHSLASDGSQRRWRQLHQRPCANQHQQQSFSAHLCQNLPQEGRV